ncbi:PIG-L family deacetylase [Candidatus Thioglobus sp.]|nr:PIG-L family deacetylase [Candidatus Thioglobus sp.]
MKILVIAPHPDDETLGCGGTLFRHKKEADELHWVIITSMSEENGWSLEAKEKRDSEIDTVAKKYRFSSVSNFCFPSTQLDILPLTDLIGKIKEVYELVQPEIIFMPYINDVHTDHQITARALQSTFKWFRYPFIKKIFMYETPSETEFNFIEKNNFRPNVFVNISEYLSDKLETMRIYEDEIDDFPFPRSEKTIKSLASFRGSQSGYEAAEAFELVYERIE